MTRAKDISKIVTDADLSGTLDVTGTVTAGGLTVDSGASDLELKLLSQTEVNLHHYQQASSVYTATEINSVLSGASSYLAFATASNWTNGNATEKLRITSGGNVGIGTIPDDKLHVVDNANAELKLQTDNANGGSVIKFNRSGTDNSYIGTKGYFIGNSDNNLYLRANSGLGIQFYTNGNNERMRIDSSGNVGIGDDTPDALLSIKGNSDAATTPSIRLKDGTDTREAWITNYSGDLFLVTGRNDNVPRTEIRLFDGNLITFKTDNTERMRIDSSGNVGIGQSTPGTKLHVLGNSRFGNSNAITANSNADSVVIENTGSAGINILSGSSSTGNIFFGDSSDNNVGEIQYNHSTNSLAFNVNASERMRIDQAGNALFNTTTTEGDVGLGNRIMGGFHMTRGRYHTFSASNSFETVETFSNNAGTYLLTATGSGGGNATTDHYIGFVSISGTSAVITTVKSASRVSVQMSGLNLQISQSFFSTANITYALLRLVS